MKASLSLLYQLFPGRPTKEALQSSDRFAPAISKDFSKDRVVCDTKLSSFIAIFYVDNLNAICQQWDAMSLDEMQHDRVVRMAINSKNGIGALVEFFDLV